MERQISSYGFYRYLGTTVRGVPITTTGLEYMIHLGGPGGTLRVLRSEGMQNPRDANNTSLLDYARLGAHVRAEEAPWAP